MPTGILCAERILLTQVKVASTSPTNPQAATLQSGSPIEATANAGIKEDARARIQINSLVESPFERFTTATAIRSARKAATAANQAIKWPAPAYLAP
jgi:hypothetical protein